MINGIIMSEIKRLGISFEARDVAPQTFTDLRSQFTSKRLIVWAGASDATIYGDPHVNHAFRAWHDACHLILNAPFTMEGERDVAHFQARHLGDRAALIVCAEIIGQGQYLDRFGAFPVDQARFVAEYLASGGRILSTMDQTSTLSLKAGTQAPVK